MIRHFSRNWAIYYFGIFALAIIIAMFAIKRARAEMYLQTIPIIGQVQQNGVDFCIEQKDTLELLSANIGNRSHLVWNRKVAQGKCGIWHGEYLFARVLPIRGTITGHQKWVVEIKLRMKEWAPAYTFVGFEPIGLQLIHDTLHYAQASPEWQKWFSEARTTEESRARLATQGFAWHSCCVKTERVKTQFRVSSNKPYDDEWHFLDPTTQQWVRIPNDVIHSGDDPTMPTQLKVEGVLFVYNGLVTCFWAPQEGG